MTTKKRKNISKSSRKTAKRGKKPSSLVPMFLPLAILLLIVAAVIWYNNELSLKTETISPQTKLEVEAAKREKVAKVSKREVKVNSLNKKLEKREAPGTGTKRKERVSSKGTKAPSKSPDTQPQRFRKKEKRSNHKQFKAQLVLVIDDFGNNFEENSVRAMLDSEIPLAAAVLPGKIYSEKISEYAHKKGKTVLLHMPMEASSLFMKKENLLIRKRMSEAKIENVLSEALETVPYAVGVNNHQGSRATENQNVMSRFVKLCKQRKLWVLDSITTSNSVLYSEAVKSGNIALKRDIFLDHEDNIDSIRKSLYQAVEISEDIQRPVIVIGHPRANTWQVLKRETGKLEKMGVQWLDITELVDDKRGD